MVRAARATAFQQQDVGGLDVAMNDTLVMRDLESRRHLIDDRDDTRH